jgi:hypothetical protein
MSIHSAIDLAITNGDADEEAYLDRLDRIYRPRAEQIVNGAAEQEFYANLAELRANLREIRVVLAEIGRALGPWGGHPDTF